MSWDAFDTALKAAAGLGDSESARHILAVMLSGGHAVGYVAQGCVLGAICKGESPKVLTIPSPLWSLSTFAGLGV